jgi:hypothetical protein
MALWNTDSGLHYEKRQSRDWRFFMHVYESDDVGGAVEHHTLVHGQ